VIALVFLVQEPGIGTPALEATTYFGAGLLPSVAQPPWQACLSDLALPICSETPGFPVGAAAWVVAANEPLISPAIAAPATIAFFVIGTFLFCFLLALTAAPRRRKSTKSAPNPIMESGLQ
jgi:hypothetical protein